MKKSLSKKEVFRSIKEYVFITIGLIAYAFAWVGVILPAKIVGGGVSGMALLIFYATGGEAGGGIPLAYSIFAINSVLVIAATMVIGFKFSTKTIYAVIVISFAMGFMQAVVPPDILGLSNDRLLSAILGGATAGIGIAVCFSQGGSTGGTDIIAMIVNKFHAVSYGKVIMFCDLIIVALSYFIVGQGITTVIYSFVLLGVTGYTLDTVIAGRQESSQVTVISQLSEQIADRIGTELGRGVTLLHGEGAYTKQPTKVLNVLCRKNETSRIFRIIKEVDPHAFTTVANVMSVYGKGFQPLKSKGGK